MRRWRGDVRQAAAACRAPRQSVYPKSRSRPVSHAQSSAFTSRVLMLRLLLRTRPRMLKLLHLDGLAVFPLLPNEMLAKRERERSRSAGCGGIPPLTSKLSYPELSNSICSVLIGLTSFLTEKDWVRAGLTTECGTARLTTECGTATAAEEVVAFAFGDGRGKAAGERPLSKPALSDSSSGTPMRPFVFSSSSSSSSSWAGLSVSNDGPVVDLFTVELGLLPSCGKSEGSTCVETSCEGVVGGGAR